MRLNRLGVVALNGQGRAVAPWLNDTTVGPYQREAGPDVWQMVTRTDGIETPLPGVVGGANEVAAGGDQWMRLLDGTSPRLTGSHSWSPPNGRVGDIDGPIALTLSDDGLTMRVFVDGAAVRDIPRVAPFGGVRLKGSIATWFQFNRTPNIVAWDVLANVAVPVQALTATQYTPIVFEAPSGRWVLYQIDALGGVCHRTDDPSQGYRFGLKESIYDPDVKVTGVGCTIGWSDDAGQFQPRTLNIPVLGEGMVPLALPVEVPDTFGPVSAPRPDGYVIEDLADFVVGDPSTFPRIGGHPVTQYIRPSDGHIFWGKFYNGTTFKDKGRYEEIAIGKDYIHHIADVSNDLLTSTTDTRWLPRRVQVGLDYLFHLPPHRLIDRDRNTGAVLNEQDWFRTMGVIQSWERFDFGPDFGIRRAVCILHDNTGGAWAHDRGQELYIYGEGLGCVRWGYYRTDRSMPGYKFNDYSLKREPDGTLMQKDFYRKGFTNWVPDISPVQLPMSPEIPPVPTRTMTVTEKNVVLSFNGANPLPHGDGSEPFLDRAYRNLPDGWLAKLAQQLRYSLGPDYGHKRRGPGSPLSAGTFAVREGSAMQCFDILVGAGTGTPRLDVGVESMFVTDQEFVPVTPVNHLATAVPTPGRAKLAGPAWGVDAFDLAPRVAVGDRRWLEQVLVPNRLVSRQFMYASPLPAPRLPRDAATGLRQMAALLPVMRAMGARGSLFTILCGTRNDGWSWQQALDYCRACNALFLQYPELVVGIDLGNENAQGFEQDYLTNPQFLREAEACFDLRFPVSPGTTWGDQPPFMACGSYLVHHGDRALQPDAAAALMVVPGWQVLDREGMGITEVGRTAGRQRVDNPDWARQQIAAVRRYGLAGSILHIDAGMTCNVDELGPVQRASIALYASASGGGGGPVPTPTHPILDADMTNNDVWYDIFVRRHDELRGAIIGEYELVKGPPWPHEEMMRHYLYRACAERSRWRTMRRAIAEQG